MELNADQTSAVWALTAIENNTNKFVKNNTHLNIELMAFSIAFTTHCFPGIGLPLTNFSYHRHPHNEVRFNGIYSALLSTYYKGSIPDKQSYPFLQISNGIQQMRFSFEMIFDLPAFPECYAADNQDKRVKKALVELGEQVNKYYDFWKPYRIIM